MTWGQAIRLIRASELGEPMPAPDTPGLCGEAQAFFFRRALTAATSSSKTGSLRSQLMQASVML